MFRLTALRLHASDRDWVILSNHQYLHKLSYWFLTIDDTLSNINIFTDIEAEVEYQYFRAGLRERPVSLTILVGPYATNCTYEASDIDLTAVLHGSMYIRERITALLVGRNYLNTMVSKLQTDSLSKVVGNDTIVDAISLRVQESEVLTIIGPSGAGKSSFLRLLNRLDEPTDGTVYLDGTDYREIDPQELRRRVGLISQEPALLPGSVRENSL